MSAKTAAKVAESRTTASLAKDFDGKLRRLSDRHQAWRAFSDFAEVSAVSLQNVFPRSVRGKDYDPLNAAETEARYERLIAPYDVKERALIAEMLGDTALALEENPAHDFLGSAFMRNELGNHWVGQFFTPSELCYMTGRMLVGDGEDLKRTVEQHGFVTLLEPAAGAGGMVLGFVSAMRDAGIEPQRHLHVTAVDLSPVCAWMTYVQLTLLHIPAVVVIGDSLSLKETAHLPTLAHSIGFWNSRLAVRRRKEGEPGAPSIESAGLPQAPIETPSRPDVTLRTQQANLFGDGE